MPHQIIVMPSAQAGIALVAKVMIDAGDTAWIESPGYGMLSPHCMLSAQRSWACQLMTPA
jgi:DNA-binding transcriptional MocR family regulator